MVVTEQYFERRNTPVYLCQSGHKKASSSSRNSIQAMLLDALQYRLGVKFSKRLLFHDIIKEAVQLLMIFFLPFCCLRFFFSSVVCERCFFLKFANEQNG